MLTSGPIVLRNSSSAAAGCWTVYQLAWTWRRDAKGVLARTLPALIFSAVSFCAFTVAGGFSSSISSGVGNEVLLDGTHCGAVYTGALSIDDASTLQSYIARTINNAANYAQQCYSVNATGIFDCTTFIRDHIGATIDNQAACPFHDAICRSNDSNIRLDSGYIDSREDLGLNMPDDQRIFFRQVLHCAPLNTEGLARNTSTSSDNYTQYWYGPSIDNKEYTFEVEDLDAQYRKQADNRVALYGLDLRLEHVIPNQIELVDV